MLNGRTRWWLLLLSLAVAVGVARAGTPSVRFVQDSDRVVLELDGVELAPLGRERDADGSTLLALYTEEARVSDSDLPPILGSYEVVDSVLRFTPRFRLAPGTTYVAVWRKTEESTWLESSYTLPMPNLQPSTEVVAIYPTADVVPQNLLRIYLHFSAPMSRGRAREHIRLVEEGGEIVEGPFVAPERELWSPDTTRLTLFFDPGRIKRGVGPNSEVGPSLRTGARYRLEIDPGFVDARGLALVDGYDKSFRVTAADRDQLEIDDWILEPPSGPAGAVSLTFPEPLDRGLLEGLLFVLDAEGRPLAGVATVDAGEARWSFLPEAEWSGGVYRIRIDTLLEDLAGNSLRRPFEVDLATDGRAPTEEPAYVDLPFSLP